MDKNMIHIDDLVRQRLSGGEEQERSGAWLNMRELLDQKMPVSPQGSGYNWRRMFGILTGLVLLATLTVGSYRVITSTRFNSGDGEPVLASSDKTAGYDNGLAHTANGTVATQLDKTVATAPTTEATATAGLTAAGKKASADSRPGSSATSNTNRPSANSIIIGNEQKNAGANNKKNNTSSSPALSAKTPVSPVTEVKNNAPLSQSTAAENTSAGKDVVAKATPAATVPSAKQALSTVAPAGAETVQPIAPVIASTRPVAPASVPQAAGRDNTSNKSKQPAPLQPVLQKDSFRQMTIVQRYIINPVTRTSRYVIDTVSIERLAVDRSMLALAAPVNEATAAENAAVPPVPAASKAVKLAADEQAEMVSLSSLKVKSTRTNAWNTRSFNEVVRDMKFNLSQVRFYPGVSAGGNSYMFGPNNLTGIQLGLFGMFTFGEHLNAMAELKYVHRFNGGATLRDDYTDIKTNPMAGKSHLQAQVSHFFKFSALQSIEMPLALRYAAGRLNFFGGANLAYNFAVNTEEVTVPVAEADYIGTNEPNWANSKPRISYNDFGARFAVGGLAGISYELSPSVQLDMRVTKNFWDNSFGIGASKVSQELFRAPSGQFSLYYRFSQKNRIPKAK